MQYIMQFIILYVFSAGIFMFVRQISSAIWLYQQRSIIEKPFWDNTNL